MILQVLIAEDEPLGYRRLADILKGQPDIQVVGWASDGEAAVKAIQSLKPHVVFLDVHMPGMSGLEVIREVGPDCMPATIFVTAHDRYAVDAFDLEAADYLRKPYTDGRVQEALKRVRRTLESGEMQAISSQLLQLLQPGESRRPSIESTETRTYLSRITVESRGKLLVIPVSDISRFHADGPYAEIFVCGKKYLTRESIGALEMNLDPRHFCRVHRSEIVALDAVDFYIRGGGSYTIEMKQGDALPVGRAYRKELERRLGVSVRDA